MPGSFLGQGHYSAPHDLRQTLLLSPHFERFMVWGEWRIWGGYGIWGHDTHPRRSWQRGTTRHQLGDRYRVPASPESTLRNDSGLERLEDVEDERLNVAGDHVRSDLEAVRVTTPVP